MDIILRASSKPLEFLPVQRCRTIMFHYNNHIQCLKLLVPRIWGRSCYQAYYAGKSTWLWCSSQLLLCMSIQSRGDYSLRCFERECRREFVPNLTEHIILLDLDIHAEYCWISPQAESTEYEKDAIVFPVQGLYEQSRGELWGEKTLRVAYRLLPGSSIARRVGNRHFGYWE